VNENGKRSILLILESSMDKEMTEILEFFDTLEMKIEAKINGPTNLATPGERAARIGTLKAFAEILDALKDTIEEHGV
jgi:hypothetical protein